MSKAAFELGAIQDLQLRNKRFRRQHVIRDIRSIGRQVRRSPRHGQEFAEPAAAIAKIITDCAQADSKTRWRKGHLMTILFAKTATVQQRRIADDGAFQRAACGNIEDVECCPAAVELTKGRRSWRDWMALNTI